MEKGLDDVIEQLEVMQSHLRDESPIDYEFLLVHAQQVLSLVASYRGLEVGHRPSADNHAVVDWNATRA